MKGFKQIMSLVLTVLGIQTFAKDNEGKSVLTDEQKTLLTEKYGEKFVTGFLSDLAQYQEEAEGAKPLTAEERLELDASRKETADLKAQIEKLQAAEKDFKATIAKLEKQAADGEGVKVTMTDFEKKAIAAGVDLSLKHNRFLADYMQGKVSAAYSGDSTIDTQELKKEFGKYVDSNRLEIMRGLFGVTESTRYMSSIITDKTEVRAIQANIIGTVLQQFVPEWTPSGAAKFTPLTIKNFKQKLNVPIKPSDIMEDIIGYMYDEQSSTLQAMPVVRYILQQLIFPKLDEERENALALGRYKEVQADGNGKYTASGPMETMDGYLTQLIDFYNADHAEGAATKSNIRWVGEGINVADVISGADSNYDMMEALCPQADVRTLRPEPHSGVPAHLPRPLPPPEERGRRQPHEDRLLEVHLRPHGGYARHWLFLHHPEGEFQAHHVTQPPERHTPIPGEPLQRRRDGRVVGRNWILAGRGTLCLHCPCSSYRIQGSRHTGCHWRRQRRRRRTGRHLSLLSTLYE